MVFEYLAPDRKTEALMDLLLQRDKVTFRSEPRSSPYVLKPLKELHNRRLIHISCDQHLHEHTVFFRNKPVKKGKKWGKPLYIWDHTLTPKVHSIDEIIKL